MTRQRSPVKNRLSTPIFVFDDYVDYLKAWYGYARRFRFTQAEFVRRAGVGTQAYFSDIIARRKRLAIAHAAAFAAALELSGDSADFFLLLVRKEHAPKGPEKELVLKQLSQLREKRIPVLVTDTDAAYFCSWKYPVVREFIVNKGIVGSLREIKRAFLHFSMPLDEVRDTVDKLIQWGLVVQDADTGAYLPAAGKTTLTYSTIPHAVVNDVKRLFIESSVHALETLPREERHITMAIRGLSKKRYESFCKRIDDLRQEFLADETAADSVDNIYALNVQLFPLMSVSAKDAPDAVEQNRENADNRTSSDGGNR